MKRISAIVAAASILTAGAAAAQSDESTGTGWNVGFGPRYTYVDNLDSEDTTNMGGLFVRARTSVFGIEGAVDYRNDNLPQDVDLKTWPVTASLMAYPIPSLYGLAGLGWYHTTLDFPDDIPFEDQTDSKLGYHVGLGVELPTTSAVRFTSEARWLFIDHEFQDIPESIGNTDADSFTLSVGVAVYSK